MHAYLHSFPMKYACFTMFHGQCSCFDSHIHMASIAFCPMPSKCLEAAHVGNGPPEPGMAGSRAWGAINHRIPKIYSHDSANMVIIYKYIYIYLINLCCVMLMDFPLGYPWIHHWKNKENKHLQTPGRFLGIRRCGFYRLVKHCASPNCEAYLKFSNTTFHIWHWARATAWVVHPNWLGVSSSRKLE